MNPTGMRAILSLSLMALLGAALPGHAQQYIVEPIVDSEGPSSGEVQGFSQAELDQMLAPIALYPDSLLSQVLIASTYPLEIVEAARWSRQNPQLTGEDAVAAVADRDWDPSVKALVAFPELLARMDEDLGWTRGLGDAMLFQEEQVMDSIQFLRARADAAGSLETNEYARVIREEKTIIIEPTQTRVVHVPYYDPYVVYGTWWRPAYPPVVWALPSYYYYGHPGFYWGSGIHVSSGFFFSSFYWPQRSVIIVNTPRYYHPPRYYPSRHYYTPGKRWTHNPVHRRGVTYRHPEVKKRYEQPRLKAGPVTRWPVQSGSTRSDRGSRDGSRAYSRVQEDRQWARNSERGTEGHSRESTRPPRSGNEWRERSAAASRPDADHNASRAPRETGDARLTAGPRTLRPNVTVTEQRLRGTRESAGTVSRPPQRTASSAQRSAPSAQRSAAPTQRSVVPTQRFTAPTGRLGDSNPRATQRSTVRSPQTAAPTQRVTPPSQARTPGRSSPAATSAPAPQPRASSRSTGRGSESRTSPGPRSDSGSANSRRGTLGSDGRRRD
jgi:hypothetical protein